MYKMKITLILITCASFFFLVSIESWALQIGADAPELKVAKWVKNGPVKLSDGKGKRIYVVEFWATWCGPCRKTIPYLSNLQKKYEDKGVVIVGISNENEDTVTPFVSKHKKMKYNVGVDSKKDGKAQTYAAYMAEHSAIPNAFVVGKNGKVLWICHPMELDLILEKIIKNKFDPGREEKISKLNKEMQMAIRKNKVEEVLSIAKKILKIDPNNKEALKISLYIYNKISKDKKSGLKFLDNLIVKYPENDQLYFEKLDVLNRMEDKDQADIRELLNRMIVVFKDNFQVLNKIALVILAELEFGTAPLDIALDAAKNAGRLLPGNGDKKKRIDNMMILARAYYSIGSLKKAISIQEKVVKLDRSQSFKQILDFYKHALELRDKYSYR